MQRRKFIAAVGIAASTGLAGCSGGDGSGTTDSGNKGNNGGEENTDSGGEMDSGGENTDSGGEMTDSGSGDGSEGNASESMGGGISEVNYESPGSAKDAVKAWYDLDHSWSGDDAQAYEDAKNTLLHSESTLAPFEVKTGGGESEGEGSGESADVTFEGYEFGEVTVIESVQEDAPRLMAFDESVRTSLVEDGEATKVPITQQFSGEDAPPSQEVTHIAAKEDGNWRFLQ